MCAYRCIPSLLLSIVIIHALFVGAIERTLYDWATRRGLCFSPLLSLFDLKLYWVVSCHPAGLKRNLDPLMSRRTTNARVQLNGATVACAPWAMSVAVIGPTVVALVQSSSEPDFLPFCTVSGSCEFYGRSIHSQLSLIPTTTARNGVVAYYVFGKWVGGKDDFRSNCSNGVAVVVVHVRASCDHRSSGTVWMRGRASNFGRTCAIATRHATHAHDARVRLVSGGHTRRKSGCFMNCSSAARLVLMFVRAQLVYEYDICRRHRLYGRILCAGRRPTGMRRHVHKIRVFFNVLQLKNF